MIENVGINSGIYGKALLHLRPGNHKPTAPTPPEIRHSPAALRPSPQQIVSETPAADVRPAVLSSDVKEEEFGGVQIAELVDAAAEETAAAPVAEVEPSVSFTAFKPGAELSGTWGDGKMISNAGEGRYFVEPGYQNIKFELGGVTGHLISANKGIAFDPANNRSYTFDLALGDGKFSISNIQEIKGGLENPVKDPSSVGEGKIVGGEAQLSNGITVQMGENGRVKLRLADPNSTDGKFIEGEGMLDADGNLVAMFQNGVALKAQCICGDGNFKMLGFELL